MADKAKLIIRFAHHGAYEAVEGLGLCSNCVAQSKGFGYTPLCQAIRKHTNCEGIHWKEYTLSIKEEPVTTDIQNEEFLQYKDTYSMRVDQAEAYAILTNTGKCCAAAVGISKTTPLSGGSVYTLYFQHIPTGASLCIECPAISVAQHLWDILALDTRGIKLQCLRP